MTDHPRMQVPDVSAQEKLNQIEASLSVPLAEGLDAVGARLVEQFPQLTLDSFRGELTATVPAAQLLDVLRFCKTESDLDCALLCDVTAVHWPGGLREHRAQETTGWPTYAVEDEGRIEVLYVLLSLEHGHRLRLRVVLPDDDAVVYSAVSVYRSAAVLEREVYDLMGVRFTGHPRLERVLMPEDWEGHPLRKDYPLGGVDVQFKGATVPPPDERQY